MSSDAETTGRQSSARRMADSTDLAENPLVDKLLVLLRKNEWIQADNFLKTLSKGSPEIDYSQRDGVTPLMICCKENKVVLVERLCELGASVDRKDEDGQTPLHYAALYSKEDIIRMLISRDADPNIVGGHNLQLPLHYACSRGISSFSFVQILLRASYKQARYLPDKNGAIPLFQAADSGSLTTCRELLTEDTAVQIKWKSRQTGDTIMHVACRKKDIDLVRILLECGAAVNAQNNEGYAPLHISASIADDMMIKFLCNAKADVNIRDSLERTPLHIAAEMGHSEIVEMLVEKAKSDPFARTKDGSTLMHVASKSGHPNTALALLKRGVPLMMPNKNGAISLHSAARYGHASVVKALLNKGAAVDSKTKDQYTSLHIAVEACKPQVIQMLLGYGAQVDIKGGEAQETPLHIAARIDGSEECVEMLIKCGADVNKFKENGENALHIAARSGQIKVVRLLLEEGSNPTLPSKSGETPIHISVKYCHWEVTDELIRCVANTRSKVDAVVLVNQQNNEGETPVHFASQLLKSQAHYDFEDTDVIKLLLEFGGETSVANKLTQETPLHYCARAGNADILMEIVKNIEPGNVQIAVNKQAKNGWSPLLVASKEGHLEIVAILLENNARVDVFDENGKASLHLASENGHLEVADILLQHKAFVNAKSKLGLTPLHLASQNGYADLVQLLVESHGASVDALSLARKTALHMAAEMGQMSVANTLLLMNADANATDEHGQTPLHLAAENDHSDVIKLFLKHKPDLVTMANTNGMTYAHIAASKGSVGVIKELMRFNKDIICSAKNKTNESTSLHLAAEGGHKDVVTVLLDAGADPLVENADGMTALHLAAKEGHLDILSVLKDRLEPTTFSSKSGFTALHVAAHFGQTNAVRELLTKVPAAVRSQSASDSITGEGKFKRAANKAMTHLASDTHGLTPLHLAAQSGHEGLVRVLLNSPGVQADTPTTVQGSIPLHLAAQNGHTAVVSLLLSKSTSLIHIRDKRGRTGLHMSAHTGQLDMVALLIGQGAEVNAVDKNGWTALHYASKAGHLRVVKLLCDTGASTLLETKDSKTAMGYAAAASHTDVLSYLTNRKHNSRMLMDDKKFVFDLMVCGKTNNQRSIEEFINLSPAPCETAAKMSKSFNIVAVQEKERAKDLLLASQFCEQMATELMAIAANANSPSVLLKSVDSRGTPFLDVLIECSQKEVVAHPTIQKYLSDVWMGGIQWKSWKIIFLFLMFIFCPPVWIVFSLPLKHKYSRVPIFKFMSYLVSHIFFIVLLSLVVAIPVYPIHMSYSLWPNFFEWLLLAWFSGLLVAELTNPGDRSGLGIVKVIIISLSAVAVLVHLAAIGFEGDQRYTFIYMRNQFLALSLLLCFVQILDFLTFHHLFGPWTVIITSLVYDLVKFLVILVTFMVGFTLHISAIYQRVYPPEPENEALGDGDGNAGAVYLGPINVFELLFFSLFGLVDPASLPPIASSPDWATQVIKVVFGMYMLVTLIVLINLLIAMMSDTYQRIQAQSDTEWKFGRSKLIRNMNKTSSTPAPVNLISKLYIYTIVLFKHRGKACGAEGQDLIDEEEGLDGSGAEDDLEHSHTSQGWLRGIRGPQISPEARKAAKEPVRIEQSIDWKSVVSRYYINKGELDSPHIIEADGDNSNNKDGNDNL